MDFIWLIPILPGIGAALNGIFGIRFFGKRAAGLLACTTMAAAFDGFRKVAVAPTFVPMGRTPGSFNAVRRMMGVSWSGA